MARQPVTAGGDYVMVGDSSGEDGGITIDTRTEADIKDAGDDDNWDNPEGGKKSTERERPSGSILGGRDADDTHEESREGGGEDGEEDARLAYEDPDDDVPRERRGRRSRRNRSKRMAIDSRDAVIETLTERLARAEQITSGIAGGQFMSAAREIDQRIHGAQSALSMANEEMARAIKDGDGDAWAKIDKARMEAQQELWALQQHKQQIEARARSTFDEQGNLRATQPQPGAGTDPKLKRQADHLSAIFQDRFPWFDPEGRTRHDRLVKEIDREIFLEGEFKPHDRDYWQEFEARMREAGYRPWQERPDSRRREDDDETYYEEERPARRGAADRREPNRPPTAAVRPSRPGNERGVVTRLDATQNDALRQLGLLEEPGEAPIKLSEDDAARRDRIVGKWVAAKKQRR